MKKIRKKILSRRDSLMKIKIPKHVTGLGLLKKSRNIVKRSLPPQRLSIET
jgi:hypothetical protein